MDKKRERRTFPGEMRIVPGEKPQIVGHAAVFNSLSEDLGGFREIVLPGAFAETVQRDDIAALWNHNTDIVLGRNTSGHLTMREDETGLYIEIDPPSWATSQLETIERGDVHQMSFGFYTEDDRWDKERNIRELVKVRLFDVSPVTFPAYTATDVQVRALEEAGFNYIELCRIYDESPGEISDTDRAIVNDAIEALSGLTDSGEGERHSQVPMLKRQLEILKRRYAPGGAK